MEITKREILFSVIIVLLMFLIGLFICNSITDGIAESNEEYYKAVKITDQEQFQYGLKTAIGNALVYGEVKSIDTVSIPELSGEYFYIEKIKEKYIMKTRTVTTGKTTTVQIYYEWDRVDSDELISKQFEFLGVTLSNQLIGLPKHKVDLSKIETSTSNVRNNYLYESGHDDIRYYFYIIPKSFNAVIEAKIKQNEIVSFNDDRSIYVHYETDIEKLIKHLENDEQVATVVFWIVWILSTTGAVIGFYYIENRWLEE